MGWYEDLFGDTPQTPNAAADVRRAVEPTVAPMRSGIGRIDPTALAMRDDMRANIGPAMDFEKSIGDMRQKAIDSYQAEPDPIGGFVDHPGWGTGFKALGQVLRAASIPVSYAQGNPGYGANMQNQINKEQEGRDAYGDERRKLGLENMDKTISGIGSLGSDYIAKKQALKIEAQQQVAKIAQMAALNAGPGEDPHDAAAKALRLYTPQLRAQGLADVADLVEKSYPLSSNPSSAPAVAPPSAAAPLPASSAPPQSNFSPLPAPGPDQRPGPTMAAANAAPPTVPDFAAGLKSAVAPQAIDQSPASPPAPVAAPQAADNEQSALVALQKKRDTLRMLGYKDEAGDVQKDIDNLGKNTKFEKWTDENGLEHPYVANALDPNSAHNLKLEGMSGSGGSSSYGDYSKTGPEFLDTIKDPAFKNEVMDVIEGRKMPMAGNRMNKHGMLVNKAVEAADRSFDFNDAPARASFIGDLAKSTPNSRGNMRQLLGTFANHLDETLHAAKGLNNGDVLAWNAAKNEFENQTGKPQISAFNTAVHSLQQELGKFLAGGQVTVDEAKTMQSLISSVKSPAQIRSVLDTWNHLIAGKGEALDNAGKMVMQGAFKPEKHSVLTPEARATLSKYESDDWGRPIPAAMNKDEAAKMPLNKSFKFNGHILKRTGDGQFAQVQ
jgi:hypothetical protein